MATGNPNNLGEMIPLAGAADEDLGLVLPAVFAEAAAGMPPPRPRPAHRPVLPLRGAEGRPGRGASSQAAPAPSAAAPVADASRADRSRTLLYAGADDEEPSAVGLDLTGELSRVIDRHAALETQTAILESEFQAKETALTERLEVALLERTEALSAQAHADLRSERGLMQRRLDEATAAAQHECHERLAASSRELRAAEQQMAATDRQQLAGILAAESAAYAAADQRRREECDAIHAEALRNLEAQRVELSAVVSTASSRLAAAGELEAAASRAEQQSQAQAAEAQQHAAAAAQLESSTQQAFVGFEGRTRLQLRQYEAQIANLEAQQEQMKLRADRAAGLEAQVTVFHSRLTESEQRVHALRDRAQRWANDLAATAEAQRGELLEVQTALQQRVDILEQEVENWKHIASVAEERRVQPPQHAPVLSEPPPPPLQPQPDRLTGRFVTADGVLTQPQHFDMATPSRLLAAPQLGAAAASEPAPAPHAQPRPGPNRGVLPGHGAGVTMRAHIAAAGAPGGGGPPDRPGAGGSVRSEPAQRLPTQLQQRPSAAQAPAAQPDLPPGLQGPRRPDGDDGAGGDDSPPSTPGASGARRSRKSKKSKRSPSSSSSSTEDDIRRRKGAVKSLTLDPLPSAVGFREWVQDTYVKVNAASKRSKRRALRRLQRIETASDISELEALAEKQKRWDDLDSVLAEAVLAIANSNLKRELLIYREERSRMGLPLSGRCALYMVYYRYTIERGQALSVDLTTLVSLRFGGDLEGFLNAWDYALMALAKVPDEDLLCSLLECQLRKCKGLEPAFVTFDAAEEGSETRTSAFLYNAARREVVRRQRWQVKDDLM